MSIITKRGDEGFTDRLNGGKVRKDSLLIEAIGAIDELNAWIGFAQRMEPVARLQNIQPTLVDIMGELSSADNAFYLSHYPALGKGAVTGLEDAVKLLETDRKFRDWQTPSSHWDIACRICRRAERAVLRLHFSGEGEVREMVRVYINRLSDYLWILGRQ